jgi:hypothetical protein
LTATKAAATKVAQGDPHPAHQHAEHDSIQSGWHQYRSLPILGCRVRTPLCHRLERVTGALEEGFDLAGLIEQILFRVDGFSRLPHLSDLRAQLRIALLLHRRHQMP